MYVSIYVYAHLFIYLSMYISIYLSRYLSIYSNSLSVYLSMYISIYVYAHYSIYISMCLSVHVYIYVYVYVSFYASICLSIYACIYLFVLYLCIYLCVPPYICVYISENLCKQFYYCTSVKLPSTLFGLIQSNYGQSSFSGECEKLFVADLSVLRIWGSGVQRVQAIFSRWLLVWKIFGNIEVLKGYRPHKRILIIDQRLYLSFSTRLCFGRSYICYFAGNFEKRIFARKGKLEFVWKI